MKQARPIQVNDLLRDSKGRTWKVIETPPFGKVSLYQQDQCLFLDTYKKQISDWERVSKEISGA